jgi:hypothetical protein
MKKASNSDLHVRPLCSKGLSNLCMPPGVVRIAQSRKLPCIVCVAQLGTAAFVCGGAGKGSSRRTLNDNINMDVSNSVVKIWI